VHVIGGILFGVASVVAFFAFLFSGFLNSYCTKSPGEGGTRRVFDATIGMFLAALAGLIAAAVSWRRGNPMVWVRLVVVVLVGTALVVVLNRPMHYCWF
jgi:intracellular septation protein A